MLTVLENQYLYVEKYRPQTIDECVLPQNLKDTFNEYVKTGDIPNFLFTGGAGVGKTTVAKALCNEIGAEYLFINASEESGIDTLRTKIRSFASTVSLTGDKKVVILDEADYLNPNSTQPALRGFIEEFSNNCRFILTCNFKNRIIQPLHSRTAVIDFKIEAQDKPQIAADFFKRVLSILDNEEITYDKKVVAELVSRHFPDFRRVLNELQRYSASGTIDSGILVNMSEESYRVLVKAMKDKNFTEVRKWVSSNTDVETQVIFKYFFDKASTFMEASSLPQLILILADYQYKAAFVSDAELNLMAALTEVMASCKFS